MPGSGDPTEIRSITVTAEDVVAAAETNRTSDRTAVLRVTPPFSGRMRARLHVRVDADDDSLHISPDTLLADDAPEYPRPADTEDELRADPNREYTVESHREYHKQAVETWREEVADAIRESVIIETADGPVDVTVHVLG